MRFFFKLYLVIETALEKLHLSDKEILNSWGNTRHFPAEKVEYSEISKMQKLQYYFPCQVSFEIAFCLLRHL